MTVRSLLRVVHELAWYCSTARIGSLPHNPSNIQPIKANQTKSKQTAEQSSLGHWVSVCKGLLSALGRHQGASQGRLGECWTVRSFFRERSWPQSHKYWAQFFTLTLKRMILRPKTLQHHDLAGKSRKMCSLFKGDVFASLPWTS